MTAAVKSDQRWQLRHRWVRNAGAQCCQFGSTTIWIHSVRWQFMRQRQNRFFFKLFQKITLSQQWTDNILSHIFFNWYWAEIMMTIMIEVNRKTEYDYKVEMILKGKGNRIFSTILTKRLRKSRTKTIFKTVSSRLVCKIRFRGAESSRCESMQQAALWRYNLHVDWIMRNHHFSVMFLT